MANFEKKPGNGLNIDKIVTFCKSNVKYISASVVTVVLVVFLAVTAANNSSKREEENTKAASEQEDGSNDKAEDGSNNEDTQNAADKQEAVDEHPEITEIVSTYYNSYAAGDLDKLSSIAKDPSDMEKDYIKMLNEYVESYGNVSCTVADGAQEGDSIVSVVYDMKFAGVDETLPGMNIFYIQTDEKGELYINNRYSSFNRELQEQSMEENIIALMEEFENSDAIKKLQEEVQSEYDKVVAGNEDLQKKLNEVADAIANWKESYTPQENEEEQQPEEEQPTEDEQPTEEPEATDDGNTDDGDSSEIDYVPEGTVLTSNDSYNVRASMDQTSELVGTTAVGDSITVILSYAEGWTKVEWNGNTGYIRTDLLLNN